MGAEALVTVFVFHLHSPVDFLLCAFDRHIIGCFGSQTGVIHMSIYITDAQCY